MKTKGKRTIVDNVDVEIDACEFLGKIYDAWLPVGYSHLGSDGYWYKTDGFDYHKREDLYVKDRKATNEELEFDKAYLIMRNFVKEHDL